MRRKMNDQEKQEKTQLEQKEVSGNISQQEKTRLTELRNKQ